MSCHLLRPASIHCLGTMPSFTLFGEQPINIEYTFAISFFHSCGSTLPLTTKPISHALESFLFFTLPPHKFTTDTSPISSSFYFSFSAPDHGLTFLLVLPPRGSLSPQHIDSEWSFLGQSVNHKPRDAIESTSSTCILVHQRKMVQEVFCIFNFDASHCLLLLFSQS